MRSTQRVWGIIIAIIIVGGAGIGAWYVSIDTVSTDNEQISETIGQIETTLRITGGDLNESYTMIVDEGATAYDQITRAAIDEELTLDMKEYGGKPFLNAINGISSEGYYWSFMVNGSEAAVGIADYTLKPGDVITYEYKTY
jgi:hypothetical protein